MGDWTVNVAGAVPSEGFQLNAMKTKDGAILLDGHAPDDAVRADLMAYVETLTGLAPSGDLQIAAGMPDDQWTGRVKSGLVALQAMDNGILAVTDGGIDLSGDVMTDADHAALRPLIDPSWTTDVKIINPTPAGDVAVVLTKDGALSGSGRLPKGMSKNIFYAALPGIDIAEVEESDETLEQDWAAPLEGLSIVMPRLDEANVRLNGKRLLVQGVLKRGYSAAGSQASLKTVLDRSWTLEVDLAELAPLASVTVSKENGDVALTGVLPQGLSPDEALAALDGATGTTLVGGGEGDPSKWRDGLAALAGGLRLFDQAAGKMTTGSIDLNGTLRPGYTPNDVQNWLSEELGQDWTAGLAAEETTPTNGDKRVSLANNGAETFESGFWLPDVDFPISVDRCKQEVDAVLESEKITFVTGSSQIDQKDRALLNRLASVSARCLNSGTLKLEIGGHTDSRGDEGVNQRLSEDRANAVLSAMLDRGVGAQAMRAVGFGESEPIATNNTTEGQAQNRRITFEWNQNGG